MKPTRKLSRRSFLGRVGGGALGAGSFLALTGCVTTGYTDSDPYDPIGGGRGSRYGGITDADRGRYADPPGRGRGGSGYTDRDTGRYADPPGGGRGDGGGYTDNDPTDPVGGGGGSCTDRDSGRYGDPIGRGRECRGTGYTDNDSGRYADPAGQGRGPR